MCGISGFNSFDLSNRNEVIEKFQLNLYHRGPDHTDYLNHNNLSLISNRLSIIDLSSSGNQPMSSQDNRYTIIYNGEIYNYKELNNIYLKNYKFKSKSDTETILALISKIGIYKTCETLDGMFAFAIVDKCKNKLYLARDRNGQKPLYFGLINNSFVFSSEIKLFKYYPNFNFNKSEESKSLFFNYGYIKYPNTIYENIYKVKPGTYLEIDLFNNIYAIISYHDSSSFIKKRGSFKKNNTLSNFNYE